MGGFVVEVVASHRVIDPAKSQGNELYLLLTSIVVPGPISRISTLAADGTMNLAPHSYKNVLPSNPPIVCFVSVGQKDSLRNVQAMEDFVYNIAGAELLDAINISSANLPPDESAFDWTGLTPAAPTPATTWLWERSRAFTWRSRS
ncbi:hypothetical protein BH24CHL4_BH24CHL4_06000 [soil metagenome]